jgi:hypothetical protein
MCSRSSKAFALIASALLILSCASPRIQLPSEYCTPMAGDKLVCNARTVKFPESNGYLCFKPADVEPFFNQCGER